MRAGQSRTRSEAGSSVRKERLGCSERNESSEGAVKNVLEQCRGASQGGSGRLLKAVQGDKFRGWAKCCEREPVMFWREEVFCRGLQDVLGQRRGALQAAAAGS